MDGTNFIVGGPNNGLAYVAGTTVLLGNNISGGTDVIAGTMGNDIIDGRNGIDIICGNGGNDTITGGNQNDTVCGGSGVNTITGGNGNDLLDGGGNGSTTVNGGNGTDICRRGTASNCEDTTSAISACGLGAVDTTPPTISNITSTTSNGSYTVGASINATFTFSEAVTTTGTITVTFDSGGTCTFSGITNSTTASCTYTVGSGQNSADLTVSNVSGTIKDQALNTMTNFSPTTNMAANKAIVIDTTAPSTPSATPAGGAYTSAQSVTLSAAGSSAIYYTTNGTTPTTSSTLYTGAISISSTTTLKALAVDAATNQSSVMTEVYTIDTTAPTISSLTPADNATGVAITSNLVITFSEAVHVATGHVTIKKSSDNSTVEAIDVTSVQISGDGTTTITINPTSSLSYSTGYYVLIDATAFEDSAGNTFAGISSSTAWNFTTTAAPESTAPTVSSLSPADNATGIAITSNLVLTFSESVNVVTGHVTIKKSSDNAIVEAIDVTSGQVSGGGTTTITVNPADLSYSTDYYVQVDATAFEDGAGNAFAGILNTTTWNFTTSAAPDTTAPTVSSLSPADNATGVSFHPSLTITFSEAVNVDTGYVTIKQTSDNSTVEAIDVTSGQVSGNGTDTITVSPNTTLGSVVSYYIQIDSTAFQDPSGNHYAGISNTTSWNFTTASSDTTAPSITALSPVNGATGISNQTELAVSFDESVAINSGFVTIKDASTNATVEAIDVSSSQISGNNTSTIIVSLSAELELGATYYITIDGTAFKDLVGNGFAGISDSQTWRFTTADQPVAQQTLSRAVQIQLAARRVYVFDTSQPERTDFKAELPDIEVGYYGVRLALYKDYALLATSATDAELSIITLRNKAVEHCDLPGDQLVEDIIVRGDNAYLTRSEGPEDELVTIPLSNTLTCTTFQNRASNGLHLPDDGRALLILPEGNVAFVLGSFINNAIQIIDFAKKGVQSWLGALLAPFAATDNPPITALKGFNGICDSMETVGAYLYAGCRDKQGNTTLTIIGGESGSTLRFQRSSFTTRPFDSGDDHTVWKRIAWKQHGENPVVFRLRMAATEEGLESSPWFGSNGLTDIPFSNNAGEQIILPPKTSGTRWVQWKAYFADNGQRAPTLDDVMLTFDQSP